ncbi:MAG: DUF2325 domain-containing protein [Oscillospiraceae bacterium]|nr:DUF2325 domain-containing protein [Oscillospiraceae bacterium]
MSVVIVGGNHCMERLYTDTCEKFGWKAKVYIKKKGELKRAIGTPDLLILFTNTVSHKMKESAVTEAKRCNAIIERSHCSSLRALQKILETHSKCQKGEKRYAARH